MQIIQMPLTKMQLFCYLIGDPESHTCAAVDPAFQTDRILSEAALHNYRITHVINTHSHADHTAGNAKIMAKTGATLLIHKADARTLRSVPSRVMARLLGGKTSPRADVLLADGDTIRIGEKSLTVIHTPGHSPGSICLYGEGNLFTGDSLFINGIGRTDLPGGSYPELIASLKTKISPLPGTTVVWPGHDYGSTPSSTIEHQNRYNPYMNAPI